MLREIETVQALLEHLAAGRPVAGVRLQDVDLRGAGGEALLAVPGSLTGLVVLGGRADGVTLVQLTLRGAIVFPADPAAPIDPYRARLYTADELYSGLDGPGYAATPDARAYRWSQDPTLGQDAYRSALRALHDDAMRDGLHEILQGRRTVGIMGGHGLARDTAAYRDIAELGRRVAARGAVVLTGGGPGAMEAANLGAATRNGRLDEALAVLSTVPGPTLDIDAWARSAFAARSLIGADALTVESETVRSVGVPTWFYGHEPPNVFGDVIAKYFSNALREDELLVASREAVVVLEGAAGTVQEIFQCATPLYYADAATHVPDLVLVGRRQWTEDVPVWGALQALAEGRPMTKHLHLVDTVADALELIEG